MENELICDDGPTIRVGDRCTMVHCITRSSFGREIIDKGVPEEIFVQYEKWCRWTYDACNRGKDKLLNKEYEVLHIWDGSAFIQNVETGRVHLCGARGLRKIEVEDALVDESEFMEVICCGS